VEPLLNAKQAADLASLLTAVRARSRLGHEHRDQAEYRSGQVRSIRGLAADDAQTIASLLEHVAGSPWLPLHVEQSARAWAESLEELSGDTTNP
jgi:hypothetical protein